MTWACRTRNMLYLTEVKVSPDMEVNRLMVFSFSSVRTPTFYSILVKLDTRKDIQSSTYVKKWSSLSASRCTET